MAAQPKHAMTLQEIAESEGMTIGAVNTLLCRAFKKLRRAGLLMTARELADELERNRRGIVE